MKKSIILPSALQICVDDVGWFNGSDDRYLSRPSRTGMTRKHVPEDYIALNEIGKAIGQKLICAMVLGEWDKDNLLRGQKGITFAPDTWDRASTLDIKLAEKCFEAAENSEYIDYAYHGVLHGNYTADGKQITEQECFYYKNADDTLLSTQPKEEIERRFELFYKLYDAWGFKKKIRSYVGPNGLPRNISTEQMMPLAEVIGQYGIPYWHNGWKDKPGHIEFINDILFIEESFTCRFPWNACDVDPLLVNDFAKSGDEKIGCIMSTHWPNFLRFNKEYNLERVENWKKFFERQSEIFGLMISKDLPFAANQSVYRNYSTVDVENGVITVDVTKAAAISPKHTLGEFYISLKNELVPKEISGGTIELYDTRKEFKTYKIKHTDNVIKITLY